MKAFFTLAVAVCLISFVASHIDLSEEQKVKVISHFAECAKEENLSEEETKKVHDKDYENPSKNLKCFATCFFEKTGALKDNKIQEDIAKAKLISVIGEEKTKAVVEKCGAIKGEDRCEVGYEIFKCLETAKKELKSA